MNKKRRSVALSLLIFLLCFVLHINIQAQEEDNSLVPRAQVLPQINETSPGGPVNSQCVPGLVWLDSDGDGLQGEDEDSAANVLVKLYNSTGEYLGGQLTDETGHFLFESLQAGLYNVEVIRPFGIKFVDSSGDPTEKWYQRESVLCDESTVDASSVPMERELQLPLDISVRQVNSGTVGLPCVKLDWQINDSSNIYGFNLLRGLTGEEEDAKPFLSDIPILEDRDIYSYVDILVLPGVIYDYWVEVIDVDGTVTRNRPVHIQIPNPYPYSIYLPVINNG